jgi:hypothetical protein
MSPSEIFLHVLQYCILVLRFTRDSASKSDSSLSDLSKYNTSRKAVFLPIPGSLEISLTASSINFEGNCI